MSLKTKRNLEQHITTAHKDTYTKPVRNVTCEKEFNAIDPAM